MVNTAALESGSETPVLSLDWFILPKEFGRLSLRVRAPSPVFLCKIRAFLFSSLEDSRWFFFLGEGEAESNKHILHTHMWFAHEHFEWWIQAWMLSKDH